MKHSDFVTYGIKYFTADEIVETGASLKDVSASLISNLNEYRRLMQQPIFLLKNGLTTGKHKSKEHPAGLAVDIYFQNDKKLNSVAFMVFNAVKAGFNGVGVYHNGNAYSMHLDIGRNIRQWVAIKPHTKKGWQYFSMINDPKTIQGKG